MTDPLERPAARRWPAWLTVAVVLVAWVIYLRHNPAVVLLHRSAAGARWLRVGQPFDVGSHQNVPTAITFATAVELPSPVRGATLDVAVLGLAKVAVDGQPVAGPLDLPAGRHMVSVDVANGNGPSMVRVDSAALNVRSGSGDWRAFVSGRWVPAVPADERWEPEVPASVGPTGRDLLRWSPVWGTAWIVGTLAMLRRPAGVDWGRRVRWLVLAGWVVLAVNDIRKVSMTIGYDVASHYQYVHYVADHGRLPPANGGWQFFQAPLDYIVWALLQRAGASDLALRVVPLACGVAMVELCYQVARTVFPGRGDLQAVATAVGGLLPVNLYMAQTVSNEPMAAATAGVVACATFAMIVQPAKARSARHLAALGAALGVAWLTKVSGLVWAIPVGIALIAAQSRRGSPRSGPARPGSVFPTDALRLLIVPAVALLVSGWYFARNWVQVGRPFFRESSVQAMRWWQDPGYRVPGNLYAFGHVFARPVYNGLDSVWDSLYGSLFGNGIPSGLVPWNFGLMGAGLWLSLLPTALIGTGTLLALLGRRGVGPLRFAAGTVGLFGLAIVTVFLTLPVYSCAKASYAMGTAPCLAVLAAAGFGVFGTSRAARAIVGGGIISWAIVVYLTYFVVS